MAAAAVLAILCAAAVYTLTLQSYAFVSGWLLFGAIVLLAAYNVRKRFPMLPLFTSAAWLQLHIYVGLITFVLFAVHVRYSVPNGVFECLLAGLYLIVFLSGLIGLVISRVFPARLTTYGRELLYPRLRVEMRRLRDEVEELVIQSVAETGGQGIAEFYQRRLEPLFAGPQHFWQHVMHSRRPRRRSMLAIESQRRYLNPQENDVLNVIADRLSQKHDLDHQYAVQSVLKLWLFVHVPLTYSLLIAAVLHIVLVHAFSGTAA
jgi:hypothetical protein